MELVKSLELLFDGKIKVLFFSAAATYLQPPIVVNTYEDNQLVRAVGQPNVDVNCDVTIEEVNGTPFSGNFDDLDLAIRTIAKESNAIYFGSNAAGGGDATAANQGITNSYLVKKNIGKIIDLTSADSAAWQGYPLDLAVYPSPAFAFDLDTTKLIVQPDFGNLIANNANELASILNTLQSFFVFSVIDNTNLLINDGVSSLSSFEGYFYIFTTNFGTLIYDYTLFTDSPEIPLSNLDEIKEQLKTIAANVKALSKATDSQPILPPPNMLQEIQMTGKWRGKTAYAFNILGQRNGFTSTSILQGIKEYDNGIADFAVTNNSTLDIISSSAEDTLSGGKGVRSVNVVYIDNSGNLLETSVNLNGTTLVTAVLSGVQQVLWMEALQVGSDGAAAGNIRLRINSGTVEVEQITGGGNKSRSAIFQVPIGYTGYIANWRASAINSDQYCRLTATVNTLDRSLNTTVYHGLSEKYVPANSSIPQHDIWMKIPELSRVKLITRSSGTAATNRCNTNLLIIIIEN